MGVLSQRALIGRAEEYLAALEQSPGMLTDAVAAVLQQCPAGLTWARCRHQGGGTTCFEAEGGGDLCATQPCVHHLWIDPKP